MNYTGPKWVGPLFIFLLLGAVVFVFILPFVDTEVEWE